MHNSLTPKIKELTPEQRTEIQTMMTEVVKQGLFHQANLLLGEEVVKQYGLTKENTTMKNVLDIVKKEKNKI